MAWSDRGLLWLRLPVPEYAGWWTDAGFGPDRQCAELRIFKQPASGAVVTANLLRAISVAELGRAVSRLTHSLVSDMSDANAQIIESLLGDVATKLGGDERREWDQVLNEAAEALAVRRAAIDGRIDQLEATISAPRKPGRPSMPDIHYARIAEMYVAEAETSEHPVSSVAKQLNYSAKTVSNRLAEARHRGLLSKPGQGRTAGGRLLPKAMQILKEADDGQH
jgi:hypothetical protein